jgi:NAD(P)-dependent dehydrogenase (short-subunit alcohol dehydrogenase family)
LSRRGDDLSRGLDSRRAVVTGAASGIGCATARRLAAEGVAIAALDVNADALGTLVDELQAAGGTAIGLECDVGSEQSVQAAFERAIGALGGIDLVVANAGVQLVGRDAAVHELALADWDETLRVNLTGMFLTCKHGVRALLRNPGGAMVLTGSPTGIYGMEIGAHAYSASKGGVHGLARVMAAEYAASGIRVNVVVPGFISTPLNEPLLANREAVDELMASIPMRRAGEPAEVAAMITHLVSSDASYATGGLFTVDGGLTAI